MERTSPDYPAAEKWDRFRSGDTERTRAEIAKPYDDLLVAVGSGNQPHPMLDYTITEDEKEGP